MVMNNHRDQKMANSDVPPFSRLFVVYNRSDPITESELREDFSQYGNITDVFIVKDRGTGEPKGVAYIKFTKMSEAAFAMENLNNTPIRNHVGTYKVHIAKSRNESRGPGSDDTDRYLRLFVKVPKTASESDIKLHFSKFGDVQSVKLLRNKDTNESRGIGYVTYCKVSEAAKAVEEEESENGFKAVIARPKDFSYSFSNASTSVSSTLSPSSNYDLHSVGDYFQASVSSKLSRDQIFRLFDIAPGLRNIQVFSEGGPRSDVIATYNSTLAAEYALNKLHGIEYPLREFIDIESKPFNKSTSTSASTKSSGLKRGYRDVNRDEHLDYSDTNHEVNQKLTALSKALTDATALLKSAGLSTEMLKSESLGDDWSSSEYCSFHLPPPQKVLPKSVFNEVTGMRLFFVGHPSAPPMEALLDVYCRFGNFAGVTILQRKNYGYLYYTSHESALQAIEKTDEKIIAGMTMKILKADPKSESSNKRKKVD